MRGVRRVEHSGAGRIEVGGGSLELTKRDMAMAKGLAIHCMIALHLFNKRGAEVFGTPLIWVQEGVPLVYYLGYLGEACVPLYCMCTGYALFSQFTAMEGGEFQRRSRKRILNFLIHFWLVCLIFIAVSSLAGNSKEIPGGPLKFFENFFLLEHIYNGAWWFASTYVLFMLLAPLYLKLVKKLDSRVVFTVFLLAFCVYYVCNMKWRWGYISAEYPDYYWKGFVVRKSTDLWYVSFFYVEGMILAKERVISRLRRVAEQWNFTNRRLGLLVLAAITAACVIRISALIYFMAPFFFICFHLWKKSERSERFFLFWGKHSTNIWLVHMFFYRTLFIGLVFVVKYPVFIYCFMMALCVMSSWIIETVCRPVENYLKKFPKSMSEKSQN